MLRIDTTPTERLDPLDDVRPTAHVDGVGEGFTFLVALAASWTAVGVAGWVIWRLVTL